MIEQAIVTWIADDGKHVKVLIPRLTGLGYEHGPIPVIGGAVVGENALVGNVGDIADNWHLLGKIL